MTRYIGRAILLLALVSLIVWLISNFIQPILPLSLNNSLVLFFIVFSAVVAFFAAFKDTIELIEKWQEHQNRIIVDKKFSQGPYDKVTIERSTRYYIKPKCSNIDPAQEREIRHALMATREDLFEKVNYFLDSESSRRHLLILADSGMGKTSFVLNYYAHNARRPKHKQHELALIPLGLKKADNLIAGIPNPEKTALFLDALDEDAKAIADHRTRIAELMEECSSFRRVVITCRTQFFPKDEEIPVETGIAKIGPRKAGERRMYEFWRLYLSPFDDLDVKSYIDKRYPVWRWHLRQKAYATVLKIPLLSVRPMLLAHVPDIVNSGAEIHYSCQLYAAMIDAWLERESTWVGKGALQDLSENLAIDIYVNLEKRGSESVPYEELLPLAEGWGLRLQHWQISSRSLLNRDAEGNYKFAHRSIMEYLFAIGLVSGKNACLGIPLTDQVKIFAIEMLSAQTSEALLLPQKILDTDLIIDYLQETKPAPEPSLWSSVDLLSEDDIFSFEQWYAVIEKSIGWNSLVLHLLDDLDMLTHLQMTNADLPDALSSRLRQGLRDLEDLGLIEAHRGRIQTFDDLTLPLRNIYDSLLPSEPDNPLRMIAHHYGIVTTHRLIEINRSGKLQIDISTRDPSRVTLRFVPLARRARE